MVFKYAVLLFKYFRTRCSSVAEYAIRYMARNTNILIMTNFAKKRILDIFSISSLHSINKKEKREYLDCLIGNDIVSTRIKSVIHDEKGKMVSEGAA